MTEANTAKYWKREANIKECTILGLRAEVERLEAEVQADGEQMVAHLERIECLESDAREFVAQIVQLVRVWKKEENDWIAENARLRTALQQIATNDAADPSMSRSEMEEFAEAALNR